MKRPILLAALLALPSAAFAQDAEAQPLKRVSLGIPPIAKPAQEKAQARPFMGITLGDSKGGGVNIAGIYDGTGAKSAGLKVGDRILRVGEHKTPNADALVKAIGEHSIGDQVAVVVDRKGKEKLFLVSLGKRPSESSVKAAAPTAQKVRVKENAQDGPPISVQWSTAAPQGHSGSKSHEGHEVHVQEIRSHGDAKDLGESEGSFRWVVTEGEEGKGDAGNIFYFDSRGDGEEPVLLDVTDVTNEKGEAGSWLHVMHPEEGHEEMHLNLEEIGIDLEGLGIDLGELDLDFDVDFDVDVDLDGLLIDALHGLPGQGKHIIKMDVKSNGGHGHGALHQHLIDSLHESHPEGLGGDAEIRIRIMGPDGEQEEVIHVGGTSHDSVDPRRIKMGAQKGLKSKAAQSKKAKQGACESCGCTCQADAGKAQGASGKWSFGSDVAQGKKLPGKVIKTRMEVLPSPPKAEKNRAGKKLPKKVERQKQVEERRRAVVRRKAEVERSQSQARNAQRRAQRQAERGQKRSDAPQSQRRARGENSDLAEMRSEMREMRKQLAELRKTLNEMRRQMGDR